MEVTATVDMELAVAAAIEVDVADIRVRALATRVTVDTVVAVDTAADMEGATAKLKFMSAPIHISGLEESSLDPGNQSAITPETISNHSRDNESHD